jgi:decaprenylphospho-beta-D-ribofuranose 2-oxidase
MQPRTMKLHGWGRYPVIEARSAVFETAGQAALMLDRDGPWIAHGMGKSYGDSALAPNVLRTKRFDKLLRFDAVDGIVTCESGVTLAELIDIFLPRGWFLKVTPGTKLISVGGAIAADVHGKNHHVAGCFSNAVRSFRLMLPDGSVVSCSRDSHGELFRATCGGMGLTGLILDATLELLPVAGPGMRERVIRCENLETVLDQFEAQHHNTYSVAWIDCLSKGRNMGRSVLMLGEHGEVGDRMPPPPRQSSIPVDCPGFLLNSFTIRMFNNLYYAAHPSTGCERITSIDAFFYPLDRIGNWNRMYGRQGFTQYQFVLPKQAGAEGLGKLLKRIAASGSGSFLAVLKLFGPQNENLLSFPMEGYTLALDFKIEPRLFPLLDELDRMVVDHGGRLYLAKDVRMSVKTFAQGYPMAAAFRTVRRQYGGLAKFHSLQSTRLRL